MNRGNSYKVVVAEDEPLIRGNIVKKIGQTAKSLEVVGEAGDGKEALDLVSRVDPDILITDIRMPVLGGLDLIREVYYARPRVKIVIVTGYDRFEYAKTAIQYGVKDYLLKPVKKEELERVLSKLFIELEKERGDFESSALRMPEHTAQEVLARNAAEYIRNHVGEPLTLADLAGLFRVNPSYLARVFKEHMGRAPIRYHHDLRIAEARRLLKEYPDLEVKEIASTLGYWDQCYFSRVFKKFVGSSPQEYRADG